MGDLLLAAGIVALITIGVGLAGSAGWWLLLDAIEGWHHMTARVRRSRKR